MTNDGVESLARILGNLAYRNSQDKFYDSPFAVKVKARKNNYNFTGGKPDDISIIISIIKEKKFDYDNEKTRDSLSITANSDNTNQ